MKKLYSIAMLLMLVASVSFLASCSDGDDDNNGGNTAQEESQVYTGTLRVYSRASLESEDPDVELTTPINGQAVNMARNASVFGLSIKDLVLEITGMGTTPPSTLSISDVPYTASEGGVCTVDYSCNVKIDLLGTYATVSKVKGTFTKNSNVMDLYILALGSPTLLDMPVYISVVCPGTTAGE